MGGLNQMCSQVLYENNTHSVIISTLDKGPKAGLLSPITALNKVIINNQLIWQGTESKNAITWHTQSCIDFMDASDKY